MVDIEKDSIKCPVCDFEVAVDTNGKIIKHVTGNEECSASGKTVADAVKDEKIAEKKEEKKEEIISGIGGSAGAGGAGAAAEKKNQTETETETESKYKNKGKN